jgi:capsular exopolysaccharide synthesis family protein
MKDKKVRIFRLTHLSLPCMIRMLALNLWAIIAAAMVFVLGLNLFMTWFYVPQYQANMTYAVNSKTTSYTSAGNLTSTRAVAAVLTEMLSTDVMLDSIKKYDSRLKDFYGSIEATQVGESNFIVVTATDKNPENAFLALRALAAVFPEMADFVSNRNVLVIMRNPSVSSGPINARNVVSQSQKMAIIGAGLMVVLLCFMTVRSETIQTRTGARELLDAPILASICHERKNRTLKTIIKRSQKQVHVYAPTTSFTYTEQISTVCTHLEHESNANGHKLFMITGVGENEGKSTVAANVAASLALKGHKVALVDADLRKPSMNKFFDKIYTSALPLNKVLGMPFSVENVRQCMVLNEQLNLYMLFPVNSDSRSTELLSGPCMPLLLQQLKVFDFVILDTPPMGMFPDAEILADLVDASVLVVRQDYTSACDINDAVDALNESNSTFLGCVLNDMRSSGASQYGYGAKYGYGGRYGYGSKYRYGGKYAYSYHRSGSESRDS